MVASLDSIQSDERTESIAVERRMRAGVLVFATDSLTLAVPAFLLASTLPAALVFMALAIGLFVLQGEYRLRLTVRIADEVQHAVAAIAIAAVVTSLVLGVNAHAPDLMVAAAVAVPSVLLGRSVVYALVRRLRASGRLTEPALVIGSGPWAVELVRMLDRHPEFGLVPVGFLDRSADASLPLPVLGGIDDLDEIAREYGVRRVIVAFGPTREADMVKVLRASERRGFDLYVVPRFFELGVAPQGPGNDEVWGIPLVRMQRPAVSARTWRMKRVFDLCVAGTAFVLLSPLLALLALAVKVSSSGPVLFRQVRIGQHGETFELLKLRTMEVNEDSDTQWNVAEDDRVTTVGRFLRRTSLDELPQLWNVLRGDMSLVGPRPERPHFVMRFGESVPNYHDRHRVPVGVTGWAQVHGLRGDSSIEERARFDNQYIEHWSPWRDLVILARTVAAAFHGDRIPS